MRIAPFRQAFRNSLQGLQGEGVNPPVGQACAEGIDRLDLRRRVAPGGIDHEIRMRDLALAFVVFDAARHDSRGADRELRLQPARIGAEVGERQEAGRVAELDAVG
jgi:hypothetical protein